MSYSTSIATMSNTSTIRTYLEDFNVYVFLTMSVVTKSRRCFTSRHNRNTIRDFRSMSTIEQLHGVLTGKVTLTVTLSHDEVFKTILKSLKLFNIIEDEVAVQLRHLCGLAKEDTIHLNYDLSIIHISIRIMFHIKIQKLPHNHITMTMRENNLWNYENYERELSAFLCSSNKSFSNISNTTTLTIDSTNINFANSEIKFSEITEIKLRKNFCEVQFLLHCIESVDKSA